MSDESGVEADEKLARFIVDSGHVRADGSIKADAFMPPRDLQLSVNRHGNLSEQEIWAFGHLVAKLRNKTLHSRGDVTCGVCLGQKLRVERDPIDGNPYHTHVLGWPTEKPIQKAIAQKLASAAGKILSVTAHDK